MSASYEKLLRCPQCGFTAIPDGFDVLGADIGNLFCPKCHLEDPMEDVDDFEQQQESFSS